MTPDLRLYLVTDRAMAGRRGIEAVINAAVEGGATLVQLRDKGRSDNEIVSAARSLYPALAQRGVALLLNDRADLAAAAQVDGVHLGQDDGEPAAARALLGPKAIIGCSIDQPGDLRPDADYAGLGPIFATTTKHDAGPVVGLAGLRRMRPAIPVPVVAIGGIDVDSAGKVIAAGADGVAVVGAINAADDPRATAAALRSSVDRALAERQP